MLNSMIKNQNGSISTIVSGAVALLMMVFLYVFFLLTYNVEIKKRHCELQLETFLNNAQKQDTITKDSIDNLNSKLQNLCPTTLKVLVLEPKDIDDCYTDNAYSLTDITSVGGTLEQNSIIVVQATQSFPSYEQALSRIYSDTKFFQNITRVAGVKK